MLTSFGIYACYFPPVLQKSMFQLHQTKCSKISVFCIGLEMHYRSHKFAGKNKEILKMLHLKAT